MEKYAKEAGEAPGGAGRLGETSTKAENPGPPGSGRQREKSRAYRELEFTPEVGIRPETWAREGRAGLRTYGRSPSPPTLPQRPDSGATS